MPLVHQQDDSLDELSVALALQQVELLADLDPLYEYTVIFLKSPFQ